MKFKRSQRVQELLLEEISKLIQSGLKDPRIGFATVTEVALTDNLKYARVYVSILGGEEMKSATLEGLQSARGYIRSWLGKNLYLKYIPELEFHLDETPERAEKIHRILHDLDLE